MPDSDDFAVTLNGEQWWKVIRVLQGEQHAEGLVSPLANAIAAQLWDRRVPAPPTEGPERG